MLEDDDKKQSKVEIEFDEHGNVVRSRDEDEAPEVKQEEVDVVIESDEVIEADTPPEAPAPEDMVVKPVEPQPKKPSRSAERIRKLAREREELKAELAARDKKLAETHATFASIQVKSLERELQNLKQELQAAIDKQDAAAIADTTIEIQKVAATLSEMNKFVNDPSSAPAPSPQPTGGIPEAASEWAENKSYIVDNNVYRTLTSDQRRKILPIRQYLPQLIQELDQEGFDREDPSYYEEVDLRLSEKFPYYEALASNGPSVLDSTQEPSKTGVSPSGETLKPRTVSEKVKSVPVKSPTAVGASKPATHDTQVRLTSLQMKFFKDVLEPKGMTLQTYAKMVSDEQKRNPA